MFYGSRVFKLICSILAAAMLSGNVAPRLIYAATHEPPPALSRRAPTRPVDPALKANLQFDDVLADLETVITGGKAQTKATPDNGFAAIDRLVDLRGRLAEENEKVWEYFDALETFIQEKELAPEIMARHRTFVETYQAKYAALTAHLDEIEAAHRHAAGWWGRLTGQSGQVNWDAVLDEAAAFLAENKARPRTNGFDPHNLPHRNLRVDNPIPPKLTAEDWQAAYPDLLPLPDEPTPDDLAETIEVQFTPEITQLAADLNNNPVEIYNWVHNNIEFAPIWGSIQGAQLCLETRTCNAFDTSSLLIALLRVSGIPARYQMGTIEVPVDKFMNWAGGFTDPEAAASLFASGGTPSVVRRVDSRGQVVTVKLEHVWVKAFVDYIPSGGAINVEGETWVELDPSYKEYTLTIPPTDLTSLLPFDRDAYLVSSDDESPVEFYQQILEDYVAQNFPGMTLEDFLIHKSITAFEPSQLPATLPYNLLIVGTSFSNVPDSLRQQFFLEINTPGSSNTLLSFNAFVLELLNERITLSFMPATDTDVEVAESFGGMYYAPPYLMSVRPVVRIGGTQVASGSPIGMGESLNVSLVLEFPDGSQRITQNEMTAGAYSAILLAPHIITDSLADALATELNPSVVDDRFGTMNIDNSDRDSWVGGGLQGLGVYYFNRLDGAIGLLKPLFPIGQFKTGFEAVVSAEVEVSPLFGTPSELRVKGVSIDADLLEEIAISKDGRDEPVAAFEQLRGLESSFWEHAVFEVGGLDPDRPAISTVRVLKYATVSGIEMFEINADNLAAIEPLLQVSEVDKEAVRDAVNAGLEVTIPASNVQLGGWRGVGYIVEDPLTGAGAYQISGGFSGGAIELKWPGLAPVPATCESPCHLGSGPPSPNRPTALIALGLQHCHSLKCAVALMKVSRAIFADTVGSQLFSRGYNVYIEVVWASTIQDFVNYTGDSTPEDVFMYFGHGANGNFYMAQSPEDGTIIDVGPGAFSRKFKVVMLTGCSTSGTCTVPRSFDEFIRGIGVVQCSPGSSHGQIWADALLNPQPPSALVGYYRLIYGIPAVADAKTFWNFLTLGSEVGDVYILLDNSAVLFGNPETTLPYIP